MRGHALGATLLAGWLLMLPRYKYGGKNFELQMKMDLPIAQWEVYKAYDSARECEAEKVELTADVGQRYATQWGGKWTAPLVLALDPKDSVAMIIQFRDSRCAPAESVYPPAGGTDGRKAED